MVTSPPWDTLTHQNINDPPTTRWHQLRLGSRSSTHTSAPAHELLVRSPFVKLLAHFVVRHAQTLGRTLSGLKAADLSGTMNAPWSTPLPSWTSTPNGRIWASRSQSCRYFPRALVTRGADTVLASSHEVLQSRVVAPGFPKACVGLTLVLLSRRRRMATRACSGTGRPGEEQTGNPTTTDGPQHLLGQPLRLGWTEPWPNREHATYAGGKKRPWSKEMVICWPFSTLPKTKAMISFCSWAEQLSSTDSGLVFLVGAIRKLPRRET